MKNSIQANQNQAPKSKNKAQNISRDFVGRADNFFEKHQKLVFYLGLIFTSVFGLLLFDLKISDGADDSWYIMAASDFIKDKSFPSWHGSFYPIFLSFPIRIFGLNLFVLKFISFLLMVGHFVILYKTFQNRVQPTILALITIFTAVCSDILYFSSSTFSEGLFFFLQAVTLFYLFKIFDTLQTSGVNIRQNLKIWLLFGLFTFLLSITRNIGLGIILAFIIYFIINKQFKAIAFGIASFLVFQLPYSIYKSVLWKQKNVGFEDQFKVMFQKDAYNAAYGNENLMGFIERFIVNSDLYLSKHIFKILGWRAADSMNTSSILTIIVYCVFIVAVIIAFRNKNKYMQFLSLYLPVVIGGTFISQQVSWDQARLIIVYIPLLLILVTYGLLQLSELKKLRFIQIFTFLFLIVTIYLTTERTFQKIGKNLPVLAKNIAGEKYNGLTPDLVHFYETSAWAAENLPKDVAIASRKPSMSFIYSGGREFYGINKVPQYNKDSIINRLSQYPSEYFILNMSELKQKQFPYEYFIAIRPYIKFMFLGADRRMVEKTANPKYQAFTLFNPPANLIKEISGELAKYNIKIYSNLTAFNTELNNSGAQYFAVDPDGLMQKLKDNNIKYILAGSLRNNPAIKDGSIINTMQSYMDYTRLKYPNAFKPIKQFGDMNDEPCVVFEVVY